jgi:hypothetical protein
VNLSGVGGGVNSPETFYDYLRPQTITRTLWNWARPENGPSEVWRIFKSNCDSESSLANNFYRLTTQRDDELELNIFWPSFSPEINLSCLTPLKNRGFCVINQLKTPFSFSLLFSLCLLKNQSPCFYLVLLEFLKIGAGEGNRIVNCFARLCPSTLISAT